MILEKITGLLNHQLEVLTVSCGLFRPRIVLSSFTLELDAIQRQAGEKGRLDFLLYLSCMTRYVSEKFFGSEYKIIFADRNDKRKFITNSVIASIISFIGIMASVLS